MNWNETENFLEYLVPLDCSEETKILIEILSKKGIVLYKFLSNPDKVCAELKEIAEKNYVQLYQNSMHVTILEDGVIEEYVYDFQELKELPKLRKS